MKAWDILDHFLSRASWVDRETTVDRIIAGDPAADVSSCLVAWMPSMDAIRAAVDRGFDLLMCHEPTFWNHRDDRLRDSAPGRRKLGLIQENGLVVIRNHDCWDRWPAVGIPWAWAQFLGLDGEPNSVGADGYQHRYDCAPLPFGDFARDVAARTAALGAPLVEASGDPVQPVSRIGVGTGCACSVFVFLEMGCDCCIICDDGASYWRDVQYAADQGVPTICVNHGTSEEPGMATLAAYLGSTFDGMRVEHLRQRCPYRLVGADGRDRE
jgi:putative NIF3 family GTP cyclohydrolase 1 type 2